MKSIIDLTLDAITATGKKFSELPKDAILMFLTRNGVPTTETDAIYRKINDIINNGKTKIANTMTNSTTNFDLPVYNGEGYNDHSTSNLNTGVKKREPRKNLFSEIIKLT
jgi:carboxypeptidase C (cathepsin A)